ncbi:Type IV pilus assembly protein PilM [Verrucomicrobia bacterium]|nr:Type IV pilus assembly protein PilM [Verrucomicrobiota bacterium]
MALSFFRNGSRRKKRELVLAVDLGSRTTKAVQLQRRDEGYALCGYAVLDAPIFDKTLSTELLSEHLKTVCQSVVAKTKSVTLTAGVSDALVRQVEMPMIPVDDLRSVLKLNSRNYLQQDLSGHVFDCQVIPPWHQAEPAEPVKGPPGLQKQKVLVAGAKQQLVSDYVEGARGAGLTADHIMPSLLGPINAFEAAMPEIFKNHAVALVDVGFKNSSICIVYKGELVLTRTVGIGGDRLTHGLSESMNISYAEAEGIKVGMAHEVQPTLETFLTPLGRELRASIDFFEHQQDKTVHQVFLSGGSSQSELIVKALQAELMVDCKPWNALGFLQVDLPPQQAAEIEQVAPQLTVALGAALASF